MTWSEVPLGRIYRRIEESGRDDLPLLSVYRDHGVVTRAGREDNFNRPSDDLSSYKVVHPGDLVLNKMKTWQGSLGVSDHLGIVSPAYFVGRRMADVDSRFMHHLLRSRPLIAEYGARSKGIRPSQWDLPWEEFASIRVRLPGAGQQQAIADFLDAETARIDALITRKRRIFDLLGQKRERAVESALLEAGVALPDSVQPDDLRSIQMPNGWRIIRLGTTLRQLTNGYVGPTRDILRDEGIRYIQGLHLKGGRIDFERRPYFVDEQWHRARPRTALAPGDVLIVQTGDVGRCAVVPDGFGEANCHALLIARPNPAVVTSGYLGAYLQSDFGYRSLLRVATGALHPHLEFGIRDVPVVIPPLDQQSAIAAAVNRYSQAIDCAVERLRVQMELLVESRQSLIAAAVTGELKVSGGVAA